MKEDRVNNNPFDPRTRLTALEDDKNMTLEEYNKQYSSPKLLMEMVDAVYDCISHEINISEIRIKDLETSLNPTYYLLSLCIYKQHLIVLKSIKEILEKRDIFR